MTIFTTVTVCIDRYDIGDIQKVDMLLPMENATFVTHEGFQKKALFFLVEPLIKTFL